MMRYYGYTGLGFGWIMMICMIIIAILIIAALLHYLRSNNNYNSQASENNALNKLNERFAKGEISEEEYKAKKNEILK